MVGWHYWLNGMSLRKLWEIVKDRGAWHAAVHGAAKSQTRLSDWTTARHINNTISKFWLDPDSLRRAIKHIIGTTWKLSHWISSVQFSHSVVSDSLWPHRLQHARPPCPLPTPGACSNSYPSSWWCHPTISSSVCHPLLLLPSIFPSIRGFPMSQFFTSGGQSIGVSASASVLPMNIQDWFPLGWTGWISLQSKGLSRVFSSTTVWKASIWFSA